MTEILAKARYWRDCIKNHLPNELMSEGQVSDNQLRQWANSAYPAIKAKWEHRVEIMGIAILPSAMDLYMTAIILFAFGQLNVVEDIASTWVHVNLYYRDMHRILLSLLPLPEDVIAKYHATPQIAFQIVLEWVKQNDGKIAWNEEIGQYILTEKV